MYRNEQLCFRYLLDICTFGQQLWKKIDLIIFYLSYLPEDVCMLTLVTHQSVKSSIIEWSSSILH